MTAAILTFSHCVKSVRIPSYSGQHFPAFGLNTSTDSLLRRERSNESELNSYQLRGAAG